MHSEMEAILHRITLEIIFGVLQESSDLRCAASSLVTPQQRHLEPRERHQVDVPAQLRLELGNTQQRVFGT